ncbi:zinc ABC transporter solute-binding protein [Patescibacteria group bacterium]|nr:zinc ABC transporter solute-binding protein [Patescibacteria group bacterium]
MVSLLPQIDFVENIGKDKVSVSAMIPPGFSPATYEPSIEQLKKLSNANLYIKIGHIPFEKTQMKKLEDLNPEMRVIDSSKGIEIYENDPHIWMSPRLVKIQVENIYLALVKTDPENKDFYENNKNEYLAELDNLDLELKNAFSKIKGKKILVFHPAFEYLARDYGFEQIAIEIDGKEPSAENLANIIDTAKKENIRTIFVQKQFSQKSAEAIVQQIDGNVVPLDPLAEDYIENLRRIGEEIGK